MSEKTYTPYEAARKVLEKCQEVYDIHKAEKTKEMDKCGEVSKEEMDKCGEMSKSKDQPVEQKTDAKPMGEDKKMNPKLKAFLDKKKQKKTQKMEKMMGIGEKTKPADPAPAQTTAPVNAPKPPVAGMKKPGM